MECERAFEKHRGSRPWTVYLTHSEACVRDQVAVLAAVCG